MNDITFLDKQDIFIEMTSPRWRGAMKVSLNDIFSDIATLGSKEFNLNNSVDNNSIIIDPSTLKLTINYSSKMLSNVFSEPFNDHNISYNHPPDSASSISGMHTMIDDEGNYLYIWMGTKWKRVMLSDW